MICPTNDVQGIAGCGSANVEWDATEQVWECLDCGMWFPPA